MPATLAEVCRVEGHDPTRFPKPLTYAELPDEEPLREGRFDQLPALAIIVQGLTGAPQRDSDGEHLAPFLVRVAYVARGEDWEDTADTGGVYAVAIRLALCQHRPEIPGARKPAWRNERYDVAEIGQARTLALGWVEAELWVSGVLDDDAGPAVPPEDPYDFEDEPTVETVGVTVEELD